MDPLLSNILIPFQLLAIYQPPRSLCWSLINPAIPVAFILMVDLYLGSSNPHLFFSHATNIRTVLNCVQGYGPIISYLVIVLESIKSRHTIQAIWQNFEIILEIFEKDLNSSIKIEFRRTLLWYILHGISLTLLCLCVEIKIIVGVKRNTTWFNNRIMSFPGNFGNRTFIIFFILHVRMFRFLLLSIVEYQRRINFKLIYCKQNTEMINKQLELQHHLRGAYNKLILLNWQINEAFKFSLLTSCISSILYVSISWIWNYLSLRFGNAFLLGELREISIN